MCRYKSGIITKSGVKLAPTCNDSHSRLLETMNIEDTIENAMSVFVRAELTPEDGNRATDPKTWKYIVDQDSVPTWYDKDPGRYEQEFRTAVEEWVKENTTVMVGRSWTKMKEDKKGTYYLLNGADKNNRFGDTNNYTDSDIREKVNKGKLADELKRELGDKLVPISINLLSLDILKDYGTVEGDILAIPTLDLYRECRDNIPNVNNWWWLSTPNSTPSGSGTSFVQCVNSIGDMCYCGCDYSGGVRPFFILKEEME